MKTKEIEVYVEKDWLLSTGRIGMISEASKFPTRLNGKDTIKARLIIELPDRKIEITESQFDKMFYDHPVDMIDLCQVKQKLFGGQP